MSAIEEEGLDYYHVLNVTRDAPDGLIRAAHRELTIFHQHWRQPGDNTDLLLNQLNAAFRLLGDSEKRRLYNAMLDRFKEIRENVDAYRAENDPEKLRQWDQRDDEAAEWQSKNMPPRWRATDTDRTGLFVECPNCWTQFASSRDRRSRCPNCDYWSDMFGIYYLRKAYKWFEGEGLLPEVVPIAERGPWLKTLLEEGEEIKGYCYPDDRFKFRHWSGLRSARMCPQCFAVVAPDSVRCHASEYVPADKSKALDSKSLAITPSTPKLRWWASVRGLGVVLVMLGAVFAFPLQIIAFGVVIALLGGAVLIGVHVGRSKSK